jgi:hypothetical protein
MDNILITLPQDFKEFLIAMTVAQELQIQMVYGATKNPPAREVEFSVTFRLDQKFKYFEPCLQVVKNIIPVFDYSGWHEYSRGEFMNLISFDFEMAKRIAETNQLHITEAFGAIIGTMLNALTFGMYPSKQCILEPLLLPKRKQEDKIKVLIYEWDLEKTSGFKFKEYVETNYPELDVTSAIKLTDLKDTIEFVNKFDVVIGMSSRETYIAASLEKGLIEIFRDDEECYLYNNDNLKHYARTVINPNPTAEYMWYLWENIWPSLSETISTTKSQSPSIQTELIPSTVGSVDEKSLDSQDPQSVL